MRTTGDISGFPFVATIVKLVLNDFFSFQRRLPFHSSCTLWLLYGYTAGISTIVIVNFIGASLQLLYALTYLRYTPDQVRLNRKY